MSFLNPATAARLAPCENSPVRSYLYLEPETFCMACSSFSNRTISSKPNSPASLNGAADTSQDQAPQVQHRLLFFRPIEGLQAFSDQAVTRA